MLGRLFNWRTDAEIATAYRGRLDTEKLIYVGQLRERAADYAEKRLAILTAGGARLDHRPRRTDKWEVAIQRLFQEGLLREQIEFAAFGEPRTYVYTLSPAGERAAAAMSKAAS